MRLFALLDYDNPQRRPPQEGEASVRPVVDSLVTSPQRRPPQEGEASHSQPDIRQLMGPSTKASPGRGGEMMSAAWAMTQFDPQRRPPQEGEARGRGDLAAAEHGPSTKASPGRGGES